MHQIDFIAEQAFPNYSIAPDRFSGISVRDLSADEKASLRRLALAVLEEEAYKGPLLTSPDLVKDYLRLKISDLRYEVFGCVFLSNRHHPIVISCLIIG